SPLQAELQQVGEEVVGQGARGLGEDTLVGAVPVVADDTQAAEQHGHLRSRQAQQVRAVDQQVLARQVQETGVVVAEGVSNWLQPGELLDVGLLLGGVNATRSERNLDLLAGCQGSLLNTDVAG